MDLALHLGAPAVESMTQEAFNLWANYADRRYLPLKRIEIYLAQIAQLIAVTMGGSKAKLEDFMLTTPDPRTPKVRNINDIRKAFGFNPRKKKA